MTYVSISSTSVTEEAREEKDAEESSTEAEDLVPMVSSTEPEDRAFTGPTLPTLSRPVGCPTMTADDRSRSESQKLLQANDFVQRSMTPMLDNP